MYSDELLVQVGSGRTYFRGQTTIEGLFIVAGCVQFFKLFETVCFSVRDTKHFAVPSAFVLLLL